MNLLNKKLLPTAFASILCLGTVACGKADIPVTSDKPDGTFIKTFQVKDNGEVTEPNEASGETDNNETSEQPEKNSTDTTSASEDISSDANSEDTSEETEPEDPILGHYEGDIYENDFFGIGYELKDATWNFLSREEILQDTEGAKEWMNSDEIAAALESGTVFTAMNAMPLQGASSVRITVEKSNRNTTGSSVDAYFEDVMETLPQYMEAWHAEDLTMELKPMNIFGQEQSVLCISCTVEGMPLQEAQAVVFHENYIATCGVAGTDGMEKTISLLEGFYALPEK